MDLFFLPSYGHPFSIKAGYFDTVLDVKEKIQKYKGIPVSQQTLIFNGKTLPDDLLCYMEILDCSRINLLISPDADPPPPPPPPPPSTTHAYHPILPKLAMNLFFQPSHGNPFSIEVGYFNTVLDIKMNIKKHQGIPVSKQTLIFNGSTLPDDLIVLYSDIIDRSRIDLLLPPPSTKIQLLLKVPSSETGKPLQGDIHDTIQRLKEKIQETEGVHASRIFMHVNGIELQDFKTVQDYGLWDNSEINVGFRPVRLSSSSRQPSTTIQPPPPSTKIQLFLKLSSSEPGKPLKADIHDTIKRLKEKIQETEGVHASRIFIHVNGIELQDFKTVKDCGLSENSEINVSVRPVRFSSASRKSSTKMMKVFVLPYLGKEKVPVEVSPSDYVSGLREKIEKMRLDLPRGGYCFIHKWNVMRDDQSFHSHNVRQGDTIQIFASLKGASVSSGSSSVV